MNPTVDTMTVVDGALYDTEVVDPALRSLTFFANTRAFTANGAGAKYHKKHTNLVGMGSSLPAGYSLLAKGLIVEFEGLAKADAAKVLAGVLLFDLGAERGVEAVKIGDAVKARGAAFSTPRDLGSQIHFAVSWASLPEGLSKSFIMKVSLAGVFRIPVSGDEDDATKARIKEAYGRKRHAEAPTLLALVHEDCAEGQTPARDPMTRKQYEAEKIRELDKRGVRSDDKRRNTRRAWWCDRCHERVRQSDVVVAVEPRS